ncbi:MAG: hypothetical protein ABWU84_06010 [Pyrobaculum sp.]|uniref:hypothetical protein n=1 Tax=Pyrobaculum sp. TaxID=2004705 RepID=UPI003EEEFBEA
MEILVAIIATVITIGVLSGVIDRKMEEGITSGLMQLFYLSQISGIVADVAQPIGLILSSKVPETLTQVVDNILLVLSSPYLRL